MGEQRRKCEAQKLTEEFEALWEKSEPSWQTLGDALMLMAPQLDFGLNDDDQANRSVKKKMAVLVFFLSQVVEAAETVDEPHGSEMN